MKASSSVLSSPIYTGSTSSLSAKPVRRRGRRNSSNLAFNFRLSRRPWFSYGKLTERIEEKLEGLPLVPLNGGSDLQNLQWKAPVTLMRTSCLLKSLREGKGGTNRPANYLAALGDPQLGKPLQDGPDLLRQSDPSLSHANREGEESNPWAFRLWQGEAQLNDIELENRALTGGVCLSPSRPRSGSGRTHKTCCSQPSRRGCIWSSPPGSCTPSVVSNQRRRKTETR